MKKNFLFLCLALVCGQCLYSQQVLDCKNKKEVSATNQRIKDKVVRYSGYVKKATSAQLSDEDKKSLRNEYEGLQEAFNGLFKNMTDDLKNFASKRKICERYGSQLQDLVQKGEDYVTKIDQKLKLKTAGFGADDLLAIIDWIFKKRGENADQFMKDMQWPDWDAIKERTF